MQQSKLENFTKLSVIERAFNGLAGLLFRLGWAPSYGHQLEVVGRKSGGVFRTPVNLLEHQGNLYLVAPRGETQWVKNARAAGSVMLVRASRRTAYQVHEVEVAQRAPILAAYLRRYESQVSRFFALAPDADLSAFAAVAEGHPVFRLERAE